MSNEPLAGKRYVKVTERKTKQDWAVFLEEIANQYPDVEKITLVMDNLETHKPGSLYESFPAERAKVLWDRYEFIYTPKHGSWLNMAEIELSPLQKVPFTKITLPPIFRKIRVKIYWNRYCVYSINIFC